MRHHSISERIFHSLLAVFVFSTAAVSAEEQIVFQHSFGGPESSALDSSPVDSAMDSAGWAYAHPSLRADGTFGGGAGHTRNAYLTFAPEPGHIYTYTVKLEIGNPLADGSKDAQDWVSIGLSDKAGKGIFPMSSQCGISLRRDGHGQIFIRKEAGNMINGKPDSYSVEVVHGPPIATLGVVLDTTGDTWRVIYQIDGEEMATGAFGAKPDIHFLGFGQLGATEGKLRELKLTQRNP